MRAFWVLAIVLVLSAVPAASALSILPAAPTFGQGEPAFEVFEVPTNSGSPEPTIGIPWNTDSVFFHAYTDTFRARFDDSGAVTWEDVTPPYQIPINVDPMLHADPDAGRIWAGGLHGPCSIMMYSDDDGTTWMPAGNMCSGVRFDHQSIGSGPAVGPVDLGDLQAYYCGQLDRIACATSFDGGVTWAPFTDATGSCGGFHGHIRTDPTTGYAAAPVPDCGDDHGFIASDDGGMSWHSVTIPGSPEWTNGFDPSLQFTRDSGWLYYGMASEHGVTMALSKDHGATWEPLGGGMGVNASTWLDIGQFHDPPIVAGTFADVQAGDDDRVAMSFLGLEGGPGADLDLLNSDRIYACDADQDKLIWHYYAAFSYDAGQTWNVTRISQDPVQVGGIYDSIVAGSDGCRNLLDFNDMDIDSTGRVYIGWADGCVGECAETAKPGTDGYRTEIGKLYRQVGGKGLFAAFDTEATNGTVDETGDSMENDIPAPGAWVLVVGIGALAVALRRRP